MGHRLARYDGYSYLLRVASILLSLFQMNGSRL